MLVRSVRSGAGQSKLTVRRLASSASRRIHFRCWPLPVSGPGVGSSALTSKPEFRPCWRRDFRAATRHERTLATAVDNSQSHVDDIAPKDGQGSETQASMWRLKDAAPPVMLPTDRTVIPYYNQVKGVPGDIREALPVFEACLRVGKLERAAFVLQRLVEKKMLPPKGLLELHHRYLYTILEQLDLEQDKTFRRARAEDMQQWFELELRGKELGHTTETIAYMLKASLLTATGAKLGRLVVRYMDLLPSQTTALQDLLQDGLLDIDDLRAIAEVCPQYDRLDELELFTSSDELISSHLEESQGDPAAGKVTDTDTTTVTKTETEEVGSTQEILVTPQKGMGLETVRRSLSLFSEIAEGEIASLPAAQRREMQSRLEKDSLEAAIDRWRAETKVLNSIGLNTAISQPSLSSRLYEWHTALEQRLVEELKLCEEAEASGPSGPKQLDRCNYGPFLRLGTPKRLAAVTILIIMNALAAHGADKGVVVSSLVWRIAKAVQEDIIHHQQSESGKSSKFKRRKGGLRRLQRKPSSEKDKIGATASPLLAGLSETEPWPAAIACKVGAILVSLLLETARIMVYVEDPQTRRVHSQSQPAFVHSMKFNKGKRVGLVAVNSTVVRLMMKEPRAEFLARHLPMVTEPEPWSGFYKGGYLEVPSPLLRIKNNEVDQRAYIEAAMERGDMEQVVTGLDFLGKTAWRINRSVYKVLLKVWNTGEAIANVPPLHPCIETPPEPAASDDIRERASWLRAVQAAENERQALHSQRCFMNFQLEVVKAYRNQVFYFPHNIDFRGRAYPIPPYFNHMGADHVRGLLLFAKGKALGEIGLRWLKVHLANVYGFDKASLKDREAFADEHSDDLLDSARRPLEGGRWWMGAEDPWQCLAACIELAAALQCPDPTKYVSQLPVHQDGTCNGLQHYAALGGDTWGAEQVNLTPRDRPADVYTAVADLVNAAIDKNAEEGDRYGRATVGKVTRKVVKQTVMTNVYGVTYVGAKKQVLKQVQTLYPDLVKETGIPFALLAAYITHKIFKALGTMFRGAHDIQHWLGDIGGRVCSALMPEQIESIFREETQQTGSGAGKSKKKKNPINTKTIQELQNSTIVWTTPLRMPVVQPYRKEKIKSIPTVLQDLNLAVPERTDSVQKRKQLQAFPPNFIHSLDASHMILSALECNARGLTFAAVHDSFWTHAADVDIMSDVLRDSFIRIHSEDVIGRLAAEFEARYKGAIYLAKVEESSPAGKAIRKHRKTAGITLKDELLLEWKRQGLLNSADPERVKEGESITTPASVFATIADADELADSEAARLEMAGTRLGELPASVFGRKRKSSAAAEEGAKCAADDEAPEADGSEADGSLADGSLAEAGDGMVAGCDENLAPSADASSRDSDVWNGWLRGQTHFAVKMNELKRTVGRRGTSLQFWMPFVLPKIPPKGDFNVERLRSSKYFFS